MFVGKRNKKAFTMIELLVCLVCLGFLTIAIATFASSIKIQQAKMFEREAVMANEYQDILKIKSDGLSIVDQLNYKFYLTKAEPKETGSEFSINEYLNINSIQKVELSSKDESILFIDDEGNCTALSEGVTYVEAKILSLSDNGKYYYEDYIQHIPIIVYEPSNIATINSLDYYYYNGLYFNGWFVFAK